MRFFEAQSFWHAFALAAPGGHTDFEPTDAEPGRILDSLTLSQDMRDQLFPKPAPMEPKDWPTSARTMMERVQAARTLDGKLGLIKSWVDARVIDTGDTRNQMLWPENLLEEIRRTGSVAGNCNTHGTLYNYFLTRPESGISPEDVARIGGFVEIDGVSPEGQKETWSGSHEAVLVRDRGHTGRIVYMDNHLARPVPEDPKTLHPTGLRNMEDFSPDDRDRYVDAGQNRVTVRWSNLQYVASGAEEYLWSPSAVEETMINLLSEARTELQDIDIPKFQEELHSMGMHCERGGQGPQSCQFRFGP
ncbi:MAG TPA: hypothetical protein DDX54_04900 [Rhodospirillaceae bacterium]|nr:hypothetical protein [Alphaproteobacteria bacterium]HBH26720.1 hypothetical protein [Rhodospirillaceae bacterium]